MEVVVDTELHPAQETVQETQHIAMEDTNDVIDEAVIYRTLASAVSLYPKPRMYGANRGIQ